MRVARASALLVSLFCLAPRLAEGAGLYVPDLGVRAMGRGGAFTARADDATAAWYNPAGFADQGGTRFYADTGFVKQSVNFQRTDASGANLGDPIGNTAFPFVIPFISISSDFGLHDFTFAFSMYGPYAGVYTYPATGAQRYSLIDSSVWEALYQLSAGWRPTKWLAVGASFQIVDVKARQKLAIAALAGTEGESDAKVQFDVADHLTPNAHFGLLLSPTPWLDIGFSVKLPMPVHAEGQLTVDKEDLARLRTQSALLANLDLKGDQVGLDFALPLVLRSGVRFKQPRWDVEVDFVYERWDGFSRLEIKPKDITFTLGTSMPSLLTPIVQERGYGDAFSLRVGSDLEILPGRLTGRLGYYYETSAIPTQSLNASAVDMAKHGFTLGLTARWGAFAFSLAYAHVQLESATVTESTSRQINLTYIALEQPNLASTVGSGRYKSGYDILSLGFSIDVDTLAGWTRKK